MSDPYTPSISSFKYKKLERKATRWALSKEKPWDVDRIAKKDLNAKEKIYVNEIISLKLRIKSFHLLRQDNCCCYCAVNFASRDIEQDREHIIPKSEEKHLAYSIFNLSVACEYCNLTIKGRNTAHIRGYRKNGLFDKKKLLNEKNYNIIHPNIHDWEHHLNLDHIQKNRKVHILHYYPKTKRGSFTYHFFLLDSLEVFMNTEIQKKAKKVRPLHPKLMEIRKKRKQ